MLSTWDGLSFGAVFLFSQSSEFTTRRKGDTPGAPKIAVFAILEPALSGAERVGTLTFHLPKKNLPKLRDLTRH